MVNRLTMNMGMIMVNFDKIHGEIHGEIHGKLRWNLWIASGWSCQIW